MSGGLDSAVCAALLKDKGYDCIGMHLRFWNDPLAPCFAGKNRFLQNKCCTAEAALDARRVADALKIPFYVMDVAAGFKKAVVDYFLKTYEAGLTPNPCVECNRKIKFGELLSRAVALKADYLATGHYARVAKRAGEYCLFAARDKEKDQSYFLYRLNQRQLKHVLFPLGGFLKSEVRQLAKRFNLPAVIEKKESQGLCFFPEATPSAFLERHLDKVCFKPGPIISVDGRELGVHKGLVLYTVGQRHGLGVGGIKGEGEGEGWYVIGFNRAKNALLVGRKKDAFRDFLECGDLHFIDGKPNLGPEFSAGVRIRHRAPIIKAHIKIVGEKAVIKCAKPLFAVSPGQAAVFYRGSRILGGGVIYL